jgi:quinoprotein dehydrogenase-associated probable ABC transporter substrate-binding protein
METLGMKNYSASNAGSNAARALARIGGAALFGLFLLPQAGLAQTAELISRTELRVCADPNNLPMSNQAGEGFENKIAQLIGQDLKLPVNYVWFPQVVGFVRNTLRAHQCDLVMGAVSGDGVMENTNPYYHSGYVLVTRADSGISAHSIGDPALADKRIGLVAATPPTDLLLKHGLMAHVTSYALAVDTRFDSPPRAMIQDIVDGKLDVGVLWGPMAGYFVKHDNLKLDYVFLDGEEGAPRLDYHIAMGVRANEPEWRHRINQAIERHQAEITRILVDYGVPLLDEQDHPIVTSQ